ncbi:MAG: type II toxin-antitoxin system HicB family antitoxin [Thermodesulfovibrionales bacterium]|nr:type II toxin-antitoxin system HicB family antitoxin [Thermodesulfovibrionales bacterium]
MNLEDYMRLEYMTVVLSDQYTDGAPCFMAMHPQLPGCMSHGDTIEEAIQNLAEARREYIASLIEDGLEVPRPITMTVGTGYQSSRFEFATELTTSPKIEVERSLKEEKWIMAAA